MKMNMSSPPLENTSAVPTSPTPSMGAMVGMQSTFSSSTRVTLWFTNWTTTTPATYFLTILFLFCLGMLNRFLGAFRSQLEQTWQEQSNSSHKDVHAGSTEKASLSQIRGHVRQWSRGIRTPMVRLEEPEGQETEPLSPAAYPKHPEEGNSTKIIRRSRKFWVANAPWNIRKDGISAGLEFVRAIIGYVLSMLAVMSYNVGFFFAVTGSVLLGELVFGRYTRGSTSLPEDGCHS
ncbi:copper transporter [Parastagonospora nodorum]|nr:copper transporter [Parastagonospora nodorum]KAH4018841.1 copper transporter [Parastagonospora nodorum]KAH4061713.1 copper transporter [Parastagonospora nodorum]KAH4080031.1 copper transporter [Parastagonospora nodorum]KAH4183177.1 copper transporter [Parastagonospora nodorum]